MAIWTRRDGGRAAIFPDFRFLKFHLFGKSARGSFFLSFRLLWVLALCFSSGIRCKPVYESNHNLFDVHFRVQLSCRREKGSERVEVKFICKDLAFGS